MILRMEAYSKDSERLKSAGAHMARSAHWQERFMAALACASESNLRQLNAFLRTGLAVVFLFELGTWLEVARFEPALLHTEQLFFIFDIAIVAGALHARAGYRCAGAVGRAMAGRA